MLLVKENKNRNVEKIEKTMQKPLRIKRSDDTPEVIFDRSTKEFRLLGMSLPEDTNKFYSPLQNWMREYVKSPIEYTEFIIDLSYFNSSSANRIVSLIIELEEIPENQKCVKVIWKYDKNDELMQESGENIQGAVKVPFVLEPY